MAKKYPEYIVIAFIKGYPFEVFRFVDLGISKFKALELTLFSPCSYYIFNSFTGEVCYENFV
nr:hypothetical protein [Sulfurospirillum sp. 'SP']